MKSKTFLLVILSILAIGTQSAKAQETQDKKAHEIYLYGNLLEFNLTGIAFKSEIRPNRFFRISATNLGFSNQVQNPDKPQHTKSLSFSGGLQLGLENRISITERLSAFYGVDLTASLTYQKNEFVAPANTITNRSSVFSPGFSFGSGFILNVARNFFVSVELEPSIFMNFTSQESKAQSVTTKNVTTSYHFHLDSDDVKIGLIYRW